MGTDKRILNLILAVMAYQNARNIKPNPFVKGFGTTQNTEKAYQNMLSALELCEDYYPEVSEFVGELWEAEEASPSV